MANSLQNKPEEQGLFSWTKNRLRRDLIARHQYFQKSKLLNNNVLVNLAGKDMKKINSWIFLSKEMKIKNQCLMSKSEID